MVLCYSLPWFITHFVILHYQVLTSLTHCRDAQHPPSRLNSPVASSVARRLASLLTYPLTQHWCAHLFSHLTSPVSTLLCASTASNCHFIPPLRHFTLFTLPLDHFTTSPLHRNVHRQRCQSSLFITSSHHTRITHITSSQWTKTVVSIKPLIHLIQAFHNPDSTSTKSKP